MDEWYDNEGNESLIEDLLMIAKALANGKESLVDLEITFDNVDFLRENPIWFSSSESHEV